MMELLARSRWCTELRWGWCSPCSSSYSLSSMADDDAVGLSTPREAILDSCDGGNGCGMEDRKTGGIFWGGGKERYGDGVRDQGREADKILGRYRTCDSPVRSGRRDRNPPGGGQLAVNKPKQLESDGGCKAFLWRCGGPVCVHTKAIELLGPGAAAGQSSPCCPSLCFIDKRTPKRASTPRVTASEDI